MVRRIRPDIRGNGLRLEQSSSGPANRRCNRVPSSCQHRLSQHDCRNPNRWRARAGSAVRFFSSARRSEGGYRNRRRGLVGVGVGRRKRSTLRPVVCCDRLKADETNGVRRVNCSQLSALRLAALNGVPVLAQTPEAETLADTLCARCLCQRRRQPMLHIAVAAVNGVAFFDVELHPYRQCDSTPRIEAICRQMGYEPPVICTPNELLGPGDES